MKTFLIIIAVLALIGGAIWVGTKYFGLFSDRDKDGIPDEVEDTATEVKRRAKRVKEELKDVVEAAKDVVDQAGDIGAAVKGKPRKGRKPRAKKASK
jgi:hypothetical protein|tara:strand:- start:125 stop:415 length:291 start_codon:yes stop_codon:yes gene_type:complete